MGLDGVELIMAVEEKFGINISDEEAQNVLTVGDMKRLVRAKLDIVDDRTCLTQRAFHLIRTKAIAEFGLPRRNLRPDAYLENVIPQNNRRETWAHFQLSLGVPGLPELVRSYGVTFSLTALSLSFAVVAIWYGALHPVRFGPALIFGLTAAALVGWASARFTISLKTHFSAGYDRVADLARFLVARYPQMLGKPRTTKWSEEELWCLLKEVIIEQLGVSKFDENSRFTKDLHVDE
jgi:hypothetical protein